MSNYTAHQNFTSCSSEMHDNVVDRLENLESIVEMRSELMHFSSLVCQYCRRTTVYVVQYIA